MPRMGSPSTRADRNGVGDREAQRGHDDRVGDVLELRLNLVSVDFFGRPSGQTRGFPRPPRDGVSPLRFSEASLWPSGMRCDASHLGKLHHALAIGDGFTFDAAFPPQRDRCPANATYVLRLRRSLGGWNRRTAFRFPLVALSQPRRDRTVGFEYC